MNLVFGLSNTSCVISEISLPQSLVIIKQMLDTEFVLVYVCTHININIAYIQILGTS